MAAGGARDDRTSARSRAPTLRFLGAARTVTGSRVLVDTPRARVLVDCGLFQGGKELRARNWEPFPVDPRSLHAVVLTHAHLDHSGHLPRLVREGFAGPVFCTPNTAALCGILLPDSGRLQEEDAAYANRKGFSRHAPALPLYTEDDARAALRRLRTVEFGERFEAAPGIDAVLQHGGHILGAGWVQLEVDGADRHSLVVSGDLGRPEHPILRPPDPLVACETLLLESTHGGRVHEPESGVDRLAEAVARTAARGGTIVIPAFSVDRTEVLLLRLRELAEVGRIPRLPVFVDSPMALDALRVYERAALDRDPEIRPELQGRADWLDPGELVEARDTEASKAIHGVEEPAIILSASGMATGGRVLHHLARRLPDPRNAVVLVGYQAAGTRGRALLDGAPALKIFGRYVPVRAEVVNAPGFSAHADREELLAWVAGAARAPRTIFLVHGEPESSFALRDRIGATTAVVPEHGEIVRLD
jgi:metallo-beta-lactamase family protein